MNASPQKALIIYCPLQPNVPILNIDQLTKLGCSGSLLLESDNNKGTSPSNTISQILGLYNHENKEASKVYSERFNKLKLTIVSNNPASKDIAGSLSCNLCESSDLERIKQLISQKSDYDCIFIDLTDIENPWSLADQIIKECLDTTPDLLKCVVAPAVGNGQHFKKQSQWWDELVPQQSSLIKNGNKVDVVQDSFLICSYLHTGSTRIDLANRFDAEDIVENGCNKSILAWHFLREIGHKLGFVPKYGA